MFSKTAPRRASLAAGVAVVALLHATPALADRAIDADQNARIARLEAAVQALSDQLAQRNQTNAQEVARNAELTQQVADLQAQVEDLHQSTAAGLADVRTAATANTVSLANGRPTFATSDGQFTASLRGVFQLDSAIYSQDRAGPLATDPRRGSFGDTAAGGENDHARDLSDGTNFRRARIGIEGRAFGNFEYNFLYDFGGAGVEDAGKISAAWLQWNASPTLHIRAGAFSPPAGLEEVASTNGALFAERASPSEVVRSIAASDGRSAVGVFGNGDNWEYSVALSGGVVATASFDEQAAVVSRFSFVPYRRDNSIVHLGVNSTYVIQPAATGPDVAPAGSATPIRLRDRPELRVDGTRLVDTGNIDADHLLSVGGEFAWQYSNFYAQAEYFDIRVQRRNSTLADPHFNGWYVQGAWTITGEPRRYTVATGAFDSPRPTHPFSLSQHGWGAWELGLRYSDLDLNFDEGAPGSAPFADSVRGGEQQIFTVGLNWYLNNTVKLMAAFQSVSVDRLSPGGTAFGSYAPGATPAAGTQVGQDLQIWSLRTQYAF
jgi:phosphate-selective porin OprO/OprP